MKSTVTQFGKWLRRLNPIAYTLIMTATLFIIGLLSSMVFTLLGIDPDPENIIEKMEFGVALVVAVGIAPLLETLLFQKTIYFLLSKVGWMRRHKVYIILISALIFGSQHFYSFAYAVAATLLGIVLMFAYVVRFRRDAYWTVVAIHALYNCISVIEQFYFKQPN